MQEVSHFKGLVSVMNMEFVTFYVFLFLHHIMYMFHLWCNSPPVTQVCTPRSWNHRHVRTPTLSNKNNTWRKKRRQMTHEVQPLGLDDTSHFTRTQHLCSCPHKHLQHTVTSHTHTQQVIILMMRAELVPTVLSPTWKHLHLFTQFVFLFSVKLS